MKSPYDNPYANKFAEEFQRSMHEHFQQAAAQSEPQWHTEEQILPLIVIMPDRRMFNLFKKAFPQWEPMIWSGETGNHIRGYHARGAVWCYKSRYMEHFNDILIMAHAACSPHVTNFQERVMHKCR